ncbi:MAG: RidA family protein [Rhizobiaceae bacterium]
MEETIEQRLMRLGIELPQAAAPAANYAPYVASGNLLMTAGQLPLADGAFVATGRLGADVGIEAGQAAARACAINLLAQAKAALGDLDRLKRIVKINVFVASAPDFTDQHLVANGASDFLAEAIGDRGIHARSAIGVAALPLNAAVEIDAVFEIG